MKKSDLRTKLKLKSLGEMDVKKYRVRVVAYPKNPADSGPSIDLVAPDELVKEIVKAAAKARRMGGNRDRAVAATPAVEP